MTAELVYSPQQGYTEVGTYTIEVSAPATEHYHAPAPVVVQLVILDPAKVAASELAEKFTTVSNFDVSKPIGVDLGVDLSYTSADKSESWAYTLSVKGTLALNAPDSTVFTIGLKDKAGVNNFDLTYDGKNDDIYVKFGKSGEEKMYKAGNADLLGALVSGVDSTTVTMNTYLSMLIGALGTNCVNNGDNTFTMDFDLKQTLNGSLGSLVDMILPQISGAQDILNTIYALFGASDWNGFVAALPDVKGKMDVKFSDSAFLGVSLRDVSYAHGDSKGTIQAAVQPFSISNTEVKVNIPSQEEAQKYTDTNLLNIHAKGVLSLKSGDKSYVDYNVELMADMDILSLVSGNTDENTGKLYLRISHICTEENCGAYCKSKIEAGEGSILEVAYDSSVNPDAAYIVAGTRNLITLDFVKQVAPDYAIILNEGNVKNIIPEYTAITVDIPGLFAKTVAFPAEGEGSGSGEGSGNEGGTNILSTIAKVLGNLDFSVGNGKVAELDIYLSGLLTGLGADASLVSTLGGIFGDPDKGNAMGGLSLTINSVGVFDTDFDGYFSEHDMMETLTKVKDAKVEGEKTFDTPGLAGMAVTPGLDDSAKTWEVMLAENGSPKMSDQLDLSMLTLSEAQNQLIGNQVMFKVTRLDGEVEENVAAKVIGVSGINWSLIGEEQEVELVVSVPQTILSNTITDALKGTLDVYSLFKTTIPLKITLAEMVEGGYKLVMSDELADGDIAIGSGYNSGMFNATVEYTKKAGDREVKGSAPATLTTDLEAAFEDYKFVAVRSTMSGNVTIGGETLKNLGYESIFIKEGSVNLEYTAFGETFTQTVTISNPYEVSAQLSKTEAIVGTSVSSNHLTVTLTENGQKPIEIIFKSGSNYVSPYISFDEGITVDGDDPDVTVKDSMWTYNKFFGESDQASVPTKVYFNDLFGGLEFDITLKQIPTTYNVATEVTENGMTATVKVTITNKKVAFGSDFTGSIDMTKYVYGSELEVTDIEFQADTFEVKNDLEGGNVVVTVTVTATKAGTGKFYIRIMNGEEEVAKSGSVTIEFTDGTAE